MWLHYFKMCFRAMARQRFLSAVNLLGLAAGLASVILIFVHVSAELSYDSWLPRTERLYRIDTVETVPDQEPNEIALAPGPLREALPKAFPQIEDVARAYPAPLTILREGGPSARTSSSRSPNLLSLLGFRFDPGGGPGAARADQRRLSEGPRSNISAPRRDRTQDRHRHPEPRDSSSAPSSRRSRTTASEVRNGIPTKAISRSPARRPGPYRTPGAGPISTLCAAEAGRRPRRDRGGLPAFVDRSLPSG